MPIEVLPLSLRHNLAGPLPVNMWTQPMPAGAKMAAARKRPWLYELAKKPWHYELYGLSALHGLQGLHGLYGPYRPRS